ncbi:YfhO family protein [Maribellus maritimus]|uniref:YfhO family protein n=1 Tax=Maribellus maritimus TaxID=2870838 RepID=UPI001EEB5A9D|nr:YfhO family protein [Maribellus maritimus]MCG6188278.1 YfhO family protein [Maribellus maritimus]
MRKKEYLLFVLVVIAAFWQIFFLQNGMKWDFVDAFLPSRYFFSESVLNNQFPLWNPYLLYGIPVFADLVSVFNPEFWIVGNLFAYSNITLQYVFLTYILIAGISFDYFLKQFSVDRKLSLALSVAYMLSGLSIGNAQHIAFVYSYAMVPFVLASYFSFLHKLNRYNFVRLSISLFLIIFGGYPGFTIILGYFLLSIFLFLLVQNWSDKNYLKKLFGYHLLLIITVVLFSLVLIVAYFQGLPFLSRYGGLPLHLAQKHSFTFQSLISLILPMATGADTGYFQTDQSMSNAYFGIISLVLFLFALIKKIRRKESYIVLGFGIFALLVSFGEQFFLREFLYRYFPLMDMFQYPSIFRGFAIFGFLAFAGINLKNFEFRKVERTLLSAISAGVILLIIVLVFRAFTQVEDLAYFQSGIGFTGKLFAATRFDNIILQGTIQFAILIVFLLLLWKVKDIRMFSTAVVFLFVFDGIISTQLNIHYTVTGKTNPVEFYHYLKSSPKGFPVPELNPIEENSDKRAQNDFLWMNNNVFPKKVTFDGLVSFKLDGYAFLSDTYPALLKAIKKEPLVYLSGDVRPNSKVQNFTSKTVFLSQTDYSKLQGRNIRPDDDSHLKIRAFSPKEIEVKTQTSSPQLLIYQQNYFNGWQVFIDGKQQDLLKSNYAHLAVFVPSGEHTVVFKFENRLIKYAFVFSYLVFLVLIGFLVYYVIIKRPERRKNIVFILLSGVAIFIAGSLLNRHFYKKNAKGLSPVIVEKTEQWRHDYADDITVLLSTQNSELIEIVPADTVFFVDEKTNIARFSRFLENSEGRFFVFAWQGSIIDNNLKELLYSFYPEIVEQSIGNNSGIILAEKRKTEFGYAFYQNFEKQGDGNWTKDRNRIKRDSVSGNHSYSFGTSEEWGQVIEKSVEGRLLDLKEIVVVSDILFESELSKTLLVVSAERGGKAYLYEVLDVSEFVDEAGQWRRIAFSVDMSSGLKKGDSIKIYFWNIEKVPFHIDNLKMKYVFNHPD